jgi:dTDP-4-dehydrorhamnose reductase
VVTEQRILVLGGAGQIGQSFAEATPPEGWSIVTLSHEQADITDPASVERAIRDHKPGYIVNTASYTAVDKAESERDICMRINRDGAGIVARTAAVTKTPLIHLSTDYVFDGSKAGPWNEDDAVAPLSVYGESKEAGEREVRTSLIQHVIVRTSWAFGIHGRNFVKTMLELAKTRDEIRVVADQHGRPTAADDLARGMIALAVRLHTRMPQRPWGTFHFAGKRSTTWFKFAEAIFDEAEQRGMKMPTLVPISTSGYPTAAKRPVNSVLDCAKIESTYGVIPQLWSSGLAACLDRLIGPKKETQG